MNDDTPTPWQYKPGGDDEAKIDESNVSSTIPKPTSGKSVSWTATEYIDHKQGALWFVVLAVITAALSAAIYLLTKDYFGTAIVLILGLIVGVFAARTPKDLNYELSDDGLRVGQRLYPYDHFKSFAIIQDGALVSLDLLPIKRFMPPISTYFAPPDQTKIIGVLEAHLPYEERRLDAIEQLTRRLHF